jgi:hypothetical protein
MMLERDAIAILTALEHDDWDTASRIAGDIDPADLMWTMAGIALGAVRSVARIQVTTMEELLQHYGRQAAKRAEIGEALQQLGEDPS